MSCETITIAPTAPRPSTAGLMTSIESVAPAIVSVRGLRKSYGTKRAVDGLDLTIYQGECFALLGPNGAGKTTTVEILEGFRKRDGGEVTVLGEDPQRASRIWRSRVGLVLQESSDLEYLSVAEAVGSTAMYYPNPRNVDEVISAVGLANQRSARITSLSGGQRRRVDVALAIIGNPDLLFLDEPTTGFDPEARREFWSLVESLKADGTTVVLTTHYMEEAAALADRIGVVIDGRLAALDSPTGLTAGHASLEDAYLNLVDQAKTA